MPVPLPPFTEPFEELRRRAEAQLRPLPLTASEAERLLAEQETYRLELELQNEELLAAHLTAERARAEYADLYELAPVAYVTLTADGHIERANQRAYQVFGTSVEHLVGRRLLVFVALAHRPAAYEWLARLHAGQALPDAEWELLPETGAPRLARPVGAVVPGQGGCNTCRLALLDVSEQAEAAEALRQSEARTRLALAASGAGVVEWDCATDLVFLDEQARTLFGLPGPAARLHIAQLEPQVLPDDRAALATALNQTTAGKSLKLEFQVRAASGEARYLAAYCEVVFEVGQRLQLTGLVYDITARRQTQEEAARLRLSQQRAVFDAVLATQEEERRRMAESLHNGVGQLLYLMKLQLERGAGTPEPAVLGLLEEIIRDVRALSAELTPPVLETFGLKTALEALGKRVPRQQLRVHCNFQGLEQALPRPLETILYRLVQELLNNVIKHAHATEVFLHVVHGNGHVALSVDDDGQGFDVAGLAPKPSGIGLASIRGRVALLGGTLHVASQPGRGTSVSIELPVAGTPEASAV